MKEALITAAVSIPMVTLLLAMVCANRIPGRAEERNCPCGGCKILREKPAPKPKALRDRLALREVRDA